MIFFFHCKQDNGDIYKISKFYLLLCMLHIKYYNDNIVIDYQIANYNLKKNIQGYFPLFFFKCTVVKGVWPRSGQTLFRCLLCKHLQVMFLWTCWMLNRKSGQNLIRPMWCKQTSGHVFVNMLNVEQKIASLIQNKCDKR